MPLTRTSKKTNASSAHDVLIEIVRAEEEIDTISVVMYREAPNWLDEPRNRAVTRETLERAVQQDVHARTLMRFSRSEVLKGKLLKLQRELLGHQLLGLSSRVTTLSRKVRHIPLMDFRCGISSKNEKLLRNGLPRIGQPKGFILNSGRSYHFYGRGLLTPAGWRVFLGKCLLLRDLVDERYVGHQLVDGYCVLRLSASPMKPYVPRVINEF